MPRPSLAVATLVLAGLVGCSANKASQSPTGHPGAEVAFVDVNVIPMTEPGIRPHQTVVIKDGVIAQVGPVDQVVPPAGARRMEGGGKLFLLPGLVDSHMHLVAQPANWIGLFLAHGVTTVFNMHGGPEELVLRDAVRAGKVPGPTIYTAGDYANLPVVYNAQVADALVTEQKRAGYDFVKIHGDLPADAFAALMEAGRREHMPILGHAPRNLPFEATLKERLGLLAHAEEIFSTALGDSPTADVKTIAPLIQQVAQANMRVVATLRIYESLVDQWGNPGSVEGFLKSDPRAAWMNEEMRAWWRFGNPYTKRKTDPKVMAQRLAVLRQLVTQLHTSGVTLLCGTDAPLPLLPAGDSCMRSWPPCRPWV